MCTSRYALAALILSCGCSPKSPSPSLAAGDPFVAVPRPAAETARTTQSLSGADLPIDVGDPATTFYLAINKKELGQRWFLSAYMKEFFPGAVSYGAARSLGTRVVSFAVQNGKLFVFDVESRFADSTTFDPQLLVDAYPLVDDPDFAALPGADQYVLVDPAAGINRFGVVGDAYASMHSPPARFNVELTWLQRFRLLADGVSFEQVFTGYSEQSDPNAPNLLESNPFRASGTLGIGLRRYAEGVGYTPSALPQKELYFRNAAAYVPNTGMMKQVPIKWNIHPGMTPIHWVVSDRLVELAKDPRYQGYDVVGAVIKGIENWNQVFGFKALTATIAAPGDSFADDDTNYLIFDEDPSLGFAFANWRTNPDTGEIRGASVYFGAGWLSYANSAFTDDPNNDSPAPKIDYLPRPKINALQWGSIPDQPACVMWAPPWNDPKADGAGDGGGVGGGGGEAQLTKKQKVEQYLTHVITHEVGHTLGLRHNFKGSLMPPSSSVMDYMVDEDRVALSAPGPYDNDAIKYLYGLANNPPQQPFCTDEDTYTDLDCARFDRSVDPLTQFYGPRYTGVLADYLEGRNPNSPNNTLNGVLRYVRNAPQTATRVAAWSIAVDGLRVPAPQAKLMAYPGYGANVDAMARRLFQRLYLDQPYYRGDYTGDPPPDVAWIPLLLGELRGNLLNLDSIRTWPTRRGCVDVLKKVQLQAAYNVLVEARATIATQRGGLSGDDGALADDLLARIDQAIHPYFNN